MIGVIVEGIGEIETIKSYLERVNSDLPVITRPSFADMQPKANPRVIATAAKTAVNYLVKRGATRIIVLIDLEDRSCPVKFASELRLAFVRAHPGLSIVPVIKDHCLENWMIADTVALREMPKRYTRVEKIESFLEKHKCADRCRNPLELLNSCTIKCHYHKTQDPLRIAQKQCLNRIGTWSNSFRHFLSALNQQ